MTYTYADAEKAFGPINVEQNPRLKAEFEQRVGFTLTQEQWTDLARGVRHAARLFLFDAPPTPESRKRIERLRVAAHNFKAVLAEVIAAQQDIEWIDPREPPAETDFGSKLWTALEEADEHLLDEDEILTEAARLAGIIEGAADASSKDAVPRARGKGRETTGYNEFLDACRQVWISAHGPSNLGFSVTKGRGSGPFVVFTSYAEKLLPRLMWRTSRENVGDAIVRRFGGDRKNKTSVTGTTSDSE